MWQRNTQYEETELDKLFLQDMMEKAANERQEKNQKVLKFDNPMMFNFCVFFVLCNVFFYDYNFVG